MSDPDRSYDAGSVEDLSVAEPRLAHYLERLGRIKERTTLREVVEREFLLEFIRTNQKRIREFPLLTTQQQSIINLLTHRSLNHPAHEWVRRLVGHMLAMLNQYGKAGRGEDASDHFKHELVNAETVLLKCIQGMVFSLALIHDNFEELLTLHYGEAAMKKIEELTREHELAEPLWKLLLDHFVSVPAHAAYRAVSGQGRYRLAREGTDLVIRFSFADVMQTLARPGESVHKTRAQRNFNESMESPQCRDIVLRALEVMRDEPELARIAPTDLAYAARLCCMDTVGAQVLELQPEAGAGDDLDDIDDLSDVGYLGDLDPMVRLQREFARSQLAAFCVGVLITTGVVRSDLGQALGWLAPRERQEVLELVGAFEMDGLARAYLRMLQLAFLDVLRRLSESAGNKVSLRLKSLPATPVEAIASLAEHGMSKIRRIKIWEMSAEERPLAPFRSHNRAELAELVQRMSLEPELGQRVLALWDGAVDDAEIAVCVHLERIARATRNRKQMLGEILAGLGITPPAQAVPSGPAGSGGPAGSAAD